MRFWHGRNHKPERQILNPKREIVIMYGSSVEFPVAGPLFGKENCRGLADKSFERRKAAAQALQKVIKRQVAAAEAVACAPARENVPEAASGSTAPTPQEELQQQQRQEQHQGSSGTCHQQQQQQQATTATVQQAIAALTTDFLSSPIANIRKGGLLGVAAVGLAFEVNPLSLDPKTYTLRLNPRPQCLNSAAVEDIERGTSFRVYGFGLELRSSRSRGVVSRIIQWRCCSFCGS